jgi:hypothetical protein
MNTWTCKTALISVCALAGCAVPKPESPAEPKLAPPLTEARFVSGMKASAPDGFCFDPESLKRDFALLARCDTLGMSGSGAQTPLALITIAVAAGDDLEMPEAESIVREGETVVETRDTPALRLINLETSAPRDGLGARYWRGSGKRVMSLSGLQLIPRKKVRPLVRWVRPC